MRAVGTSITGRRLLNDGTDVYAANMNQYVRKTDTVTFGGLTVNGNSNTTGTATVASLQISGTSSAGTGCATTGLTSKTASGQLLTCQGGVFKLDGDYCASGTFMSGGSCVNISSAVRQADCPTGYIASGGSCIVIPNQSSNTNIICPDGSVAVWGYPIYATTSQSQPRLMPMCPMPNPNN